MSDLPDGVNDLALFYSRVGLEAAAYQERAEEEFLAAIAPVIEKRGGMGLRDARELATRMWWKVVSIRANALMAQADADAAAVALARQSV